MDWLLKATFGDREYQESGIRDHLGHRLTALCREHLPDRIAEFIETLPTESTGDRGLAGEGFSISITKLPVKPMLDIGEAEGGHATLSASGTYRWWNCLGSPQLEAQFPEGKGSVYAQEGTRAHALAHLCLLQNKAAIEMIDRRLEGEITETPIDLEMAENVQVYLDLCEEFRQLPGAECLTEKKFNLRSLNPPVPMFGTSDFVCILRKQKKLVIIDLKYGKGIPVAVENNPQLKYYALGVMLALPDVQFDTVETIIVQPRTAGNAIKRCTYDSLEILSWSVELIERARLTQLPNPPLASGPHCRFCRANGRCAEQSRAALAIFDLDFDTLADPTSKITMPDTGVLTPAQMGTLLFHAEMLDDFLGGLRAAVQRALEAGETVPGWKMVPRRATRKWINPDDMPMTLNLAGIPEEAIYTKKLISPAQAEEQLTDAFRALGQRAKDAKAQAAQTLRTYIKSESSGTALAPDGDPRVALPARGAEFDFEDSPAIKPQLALVGGETEFEFEKKKPTK